jgi:hypothetical protein
MPDIPNKPTYSHGSTGTAPSSPLDYTNGDPYESDFADYFINTPFEKIKGVIDFLEALDSDGDGVVDAADTAASADTASKYKNNDIDTDGDGKVNAADVADSADTASAFKGNDIDSDGDGVVDAADRVKTGGTAAVIEDTTNNQNLLVANEGGPVNVPVTLQYGGNEVATRQWVNDNTSAYSDSDAIDAINNDTDHGSTASHDYFSGSYNDLSGRSHGNEDHDSNFLLASNYNPETDTHSRYSDTEAQTAVENGVSRVGGSGLFFDFDNDSSWIELVDSNNNRDQLVTKDVYVDDSGTWIGADHIGDSNAHHTRYDDNEARSAVDGSNVSVGYADNAGDADTVDGNQASELGNSDQEIRDAVDGSSLSSLNIDGSPAATQDDLHSRYTDNEAIDAVTGKIKQESGTVSTDGDTGAETITINLENTYALLSEGVTASTEGFGAANYKVSSRPEKDANGNYDRIVITAVDDQKVIDLEWEAVGITV